MPHRLERCSDAFQWGKTEKGIAPVIEILSAVEELAGGSDKAIIWFRHQPIAGYGGRTARELVEAGHADAVLSHLEDLRDGGYA